jgi:hypothetical protein
MYETKICCRYAVLLPIEAQKYDVANVNVIRPAWSSRIPLYISSLMPRGMPMTATSSSARSFSCGSTESMAKTLRLRPGVIIDGGSW